MSGKTGECRKGIKMDNLKKIFIAIGVIGIIALSIGCLFIPDRDGLHIIKVVDLPDSPEYLIEHKEKISSPFSDDEYVEYVACSGYADLGIRHKQWALCKIPTWNYGKKEYVLYTEVDYNESLPYGGTRHIDYLTEVLNPTEIQYFQDLYGIPSEPKLPWWDSWGGKLITFPFLLISALLGLYITLVKIGGFLTGVGDFFDRFRK